MAESRAIAALAEALTARSVDLASVEAFVGGPDAVRRRVSIYRGNVQANAHKALRAAYPVTAKIVGDEFFAGLANAFAADTPSISGDLNDYGDGFAAFLAVFPHVAELPYLPDVARLEWSVHRAHYAADVPPLALARLAGVAQERFADLRFTPAPGIALMESRWPVSRIFAVHQDDHVGAFDVDLAEGPDRALVFRPRYRVQVRSLSPGAFAFLAACREGSSIGAGAERARRAHPDWRLDHDLASLVADRVLVDFSLDPPGGTG